LVHPPSGLVGGDTLDIHLNLADHAHALVTTPGATRFYRTERDQAVQRVHAQIGPHARLEWLPLETIAYSGCDGVNHIAFELDPTAELMAWDITALGLPHAQQPFESGQLHQHLEIKGVWLERGLIQASDRRLMDGPLGLAKQRCMATLVFASGQALSKPRREQMLEAARAQMPHASAEVVCGVTSPHPQVVVLRGLSSVVEPAQNLLRAVWSAWRQEAWHLDGTLPRIWSM
jgi:urease accessory protein